MHLFYQVTQTEQLLIVDFTTDLTAYYVKADGTDGALGTQDNGGNFIEPAFDYVATILNSGTNPAESIPVILQKSSDGSTWTDVTFSNNSC